MHSWLGRLGLRGTTCRNLLDGRIQRDWVVKVHVQHGEENIGVDIPCCEREEHVPPTAQHLFAYDRTTTTANVKS